MKKLAVIFLAFASVGSAVNFGNKYFEILLDRIEAVVDAPEIFKVALKVKKINKVRVLAGEVTLMIPFGNDITVELKALKKQGGEYRYMPYRIPQTPICDGLRHEKYVYPDLAKTSDFPEDVENNCPFPAGTYKFYNTTSDLTNMPGITQFCQSGDYCGEYIYYLKGKHFATYRLYATINNV